LVFGIFGPRQPILGTELAGVVETIGRAVTRFAVGDEVFAFPGAAFGSHAEYRTMQEDGLVALKPANLSFAEAAALSFGGTTVLGALRDKIGVKPGDKVLVVGASGGVGTAAVQIANHLGADDTGVTSTANLELVRSIGAIRAIDYTVEDFVMSGESWDVIVDTTGTAPFSRCEPVLKPGGRLLVILGSLAQVAGIGRPSNASGKSVIAGVVKIRAADLRDLAEMAATGAYRPVIDRSYPLEHAAEAHAYVDTGRKRGNVVLTVD
jgi:NADPH:quinone reductase-like Zn-dependent oxidoreductase